MSVGSCSQGASAGSVRYRPAKEWFCCPRQADAYAAQLGQADELADFLETHALIHDYPIPYIWLTEHTHPPTELRIDKLRNAGITPPVTAGSLVRVKG